VNLLTGYDGRYLGHSTFQPVWAELNRWKAAVFVHPSFESAATPIREPQMLPTPLFDWTHETTHSAAHLSTTNTLIQHSSCQVILSQGGGTLRYVAHRIAYLSVQMKLTDKSAEESLDEV
jgi:6-methylsalicylate decarboxylase